MKTKKYRITAEFQGVKPEYIFSWDKEELAYTTKDMHWTLTPMIDKKEMEWRVSIGQFEEIKK